MVVSPYTTASGERGVLAIIGPTRMKYAKNKSLLDYARKLLGTSMVVCLLVEGGVKIFI
jgi:transcriptional regulator of heat shock response